MSDSRGFEHSDPPGPSSYPTPPRLTPEDSRRPQFYPDFRSPDAGRPVPPPQLPQQQPYGFAPVPPAPASTRTAPVRKSRTGPILATTAVLAVLLGGGAGYLGARLGSPQPTTAAPAVSAPVPVPTPASVPSRAAVPIPPTRGSADTVQIAQRMLPSTVTIRVTAVGQSELGSGFVLDDKGRIMTNNHVVADAGNRGSITVTFSDGHRSRADILGRSRSYDLAVIQVADHTGLHPADLGDSDKTKVGEAAVAIGSPLGLGGSVTEGIVSAINRPVAVGDGNAADGQAYLNAIQTDAPINHGNSGGPLVDGQGKVIGVNSAILTGSSGKQDSGNIGIGFAIPINQARQIGELLIKHGHASYPVIDATVTSDGSGNGVNLASVTPGGAADQAGLRANDVITAVNGQPVGETEDLIVAIRNHRPGEVVTLSYERNGHTHAVRVRLASKRG